MVWKLEWVEVHAVDHCNNNCRWCNNHSVFSPAREYAADTYTPWLDTLRNRNIPFNCISVMGGEPFLHSNIVKFVYDLKKRYNLPTIITTNAFWLSHAEIVRYHDLFNMLSDLKITLYPNMLKSLGGRERVDELLEEIHARHPHLKVRPLPIEQVYRHMDFFSEPLAVDKHCFNSECTCVLADGRIGRCGPGSFAHLNPDLPEQFRNSKDMFYDLKSDKGDFWHWRMRWPLDACRFCNHFQSIRSPWKVEKGYQRKTDLEIKYYINAAYQSLAMGCIDEAESRCMGVIEKFKGTQEVYNCLGLIAHRRGRRDSALNFFRKAVELDPGYEPARKNLDVLSGCAPAPARENAAA